MKMDLTQQPKWVQKYIEGLKARLDLASELLSNAPQKTAHNNEYKSALDIYQKYFNSSTNLEFSDWLRERLNQQS